MKFVEKCPKCTNQVQTKSLKKSIGLGFVKIPVSQFCLNPSCDWYQDFAEAKKPEDIKEGFHLSRNQVIAIAAIVGLLPVYALFTYFVPMIDTGNDVDPKPQKKLSELQENTTVGSADTPPAIVPTAIVPTKINTQITPTAIIEPNSYLVKIDFSHGFYPDVITINKSDTIIWSNQENQRTRLVLVSKDNLFENQLLQYPGRYQYQFNQQGEYTFILAEYPSYEQYQNATGNVFVK